jgi:hypothetical protein
MTKTKKSNFESSNCMIILLLRKIVWAKYLMISVATAWRRRKGRLNGTLMTRIKRIAAD